MKTFGKNGIHSCAMPCTQNVWRCIFFHNSLVQSKCMNSFSTTNETQPFFKDSYVTWYMMKMKDDWWLDSLYGNMSTHDVLSNEMEVNKMFTIPPHLQVSSLSPVAPTHLWKNKPININIENIFFTE